MATNNSINLSQAGLANYNGSGTFTGVTVTQHDILVGGIGNNITSVAPSLLAGVPVVSSGGSADPVFGTATVSGGGLGVNSLTAYELIAAGITSTGAVQQISIGTSGQVLTSNGAGVLPSFQPAGTPSAQAPYLNTTTTSQTMAVNQGYVSNNASLVTFTPPATCAVGTIFAVAGAGAGGWTINLATNSQTLNVGSSPGVTAVASTNQFDSIKFVCITANTAFTMLDSVGNLTVS